MNFDKVYDYARELLAKYGKADKSTYTSDRRILWIGTQPLFTRVAELPAHQDPYIKAIATEIDSYHDFILILGGNTEIDPHRDATYAAPDAITLNLGGMAYFDHEDGCKWLKHGDITRFNCKRLHGILEADLDRIAIAIWRKNPKWK